MKLITATDHVRLAVYDQNPQSDRAVFFIHGWPLSHEIFEYQTQLLLENGFRVASLDLRGFGCSDAPAFGYCYDQMAQDVHSAVKALGLQRFVLVGFSMGGAIALRYMRLFEGHGVSRLVLLAAAAPLWTERPDYPFGHPCTYVNDLIDQAATDRPMLARSFSRQLFACEHSEAALDWFEGIALSASGVGTIQAAISLRDEDGRSDLGCVHVPTTIIHGAQDSIVPAELARLQNEGIAHSQLVMLPNSGHGIFYDELTDFNEAFLHAVQ